jgi:hypothetical protein
VILTNHFSAFWGWVSSAAGELGIIAQRCGAGDQSDQRLLVVAGIPGDRYVLDLLALNFRDGLRDALDPRQKSRVPGVAEVQSLQNRGRMISGFVT